MNKKLEQILFLIKDDRKLFLSISFGVFLFVLFFQPFALDQFDFNNRLLILAGLGGIVLICLFPPVALGIADELKELRQLNKLLTTKKEIIQEQVKKYQEDYLHQSIEFV